MLKHDYNHVWHLILTIWINGIEKPAYLECKLCWLRCDITNIDRINSDCPNTGSGHLLFISEQLLCICGRLKTLQFKREFFQNECYDYVSSAICLNCKKYEDAGYEPEPAEY